MKDWLIGGISTIGFIIMMYYILLWLF